MKEQKKIVQSSEKPVAVNQVKSNDIQIHFGNAELIKIKLLESINKHLAEMLILLRNKEK